MNYTISEQNNVQILQVTELFNEHDNKTIVKAIDTCIAEGHYNFIVDLANLNFMNSVGINFLIGMMKRTAQYNGKLALANPSKQVVSLLEITKLKPLFIIKPSIETSMECFRINGTA